MPKHASSPAPALSGVIQPVRIGFIPLADCAPLLVAGSRDLFRKHGVRVELSCEVGWATIREKLLYGQVDAAHAIAGLALAMRMGISSPPSPVLAPFVFNLHGDAITLSRDLWNRGVRDAASLKKLIRSTTSRRLTFGMVSRYASHHFLLRRWLISGGIHADQDVRIVALPPTQMAANLAAGLIDGYCVGEPWNSVAVEKGAGWVVATSEQLAPGHPEKALIMGGAFVARHRDQAQAVINALRESCAFCDAPENRPEVVKVLAGSGFFNGCESMLKKSLIGPFDPGTGQNWDASSFHIFHRREANEPTSERGRWLLDEFIAHGLLLPAQRAEAAAALRDCWTSGALHFPERPAAAPKPVSKPKKTQTTRPRMNTTTPLTRRSILRQAGLGALLSGLPSGWVGSAYADDAPEVADLKFGIIALTDCSSIVIAHEKGLFKKYGINSTVSKGASWAAIRDSLSNGDIQATHMLLGMPIASTMGLGGAPKKPMIAPWIINRNGQAISLSNDYKGKVADDPKALKPFVDEAKAKGAPLTFAMTFPPGTHAMWMRYYLAAGGINPGDANGAGADVSLITVPPPQMVANMKVGKMDGFCVGEPWNAKTIAEDIGFTSITTQAIWKDHPEKVCAFTEEFAGKNPKTVKAVLKALHEASVWLDKMENREEQAEIVSAATYINCPPETILGRLQGKYLMGDGRKFKDPDYMIFSDRNCNYPQAKYAKWWLTQFRRWGFVEGAPDYEGVAKQVMRSDIYEEAMKEIGYAHGGADTSAETLFDGVTFDPAADLEAYAASFAVKTIKG